MQEDKHELENTLKRYASSLCRAYERGKLSEYLNDCLEIRRIEIDGDFSGFRVVLTLGGPYIYIDTEKKELCGYWWTDEAHESLPHDVCEEIDELFGGGIYE